MKTMYNSNDWTLKLPKETLSFWDAYDNELDFPTTEDEYIEVMSIEWAGNEVDAKNFEEYINASGWTTFMDILDDGRCGLYVWNNDVERYIYQEEA